MIDRIADLIKHETAGDPMTSLKWTQKTTIKISGELKALGIDISPNTVSRLLNQMGYSLRVNHKKLSRVSKVAPAQRDAQFAQIATLRESFAARGLPTISVDTKKKELIGLFKNTGRAWNKKPITVRDHDFASEADGKAIPYGIYDIHANLGSLFIGTSRDTPEFAVNCIETWWRNEGRHRYPDAKELAILADGGGSNGSRCRAWRLLLQQRLCECHGLTVTVSHYPPGTSKWNLRTTTTTTGLKVRAQMDSQDYKLGLKITDAQMKELPMVKDESLPKWNYTLIPS